MGKIFDMNNPLWQGMGRIFDIFVLNCLWLLCCVPVFTIGPATTALFYAMVELLRGEGGYVSHDFFKSFRLNFKQGIILGIPLTLTGLFLAFDIYLCRQAGTGIYSFFLFFFLILFILWLALFLYVFMLLAKFERKSRDLLIWAFTLCIRHFARTIGMMFIIAIAIWVCHILIGLIFIAPGLAADEITEVFLPILSPYLPADDEEE